MLQWVRATELVSIVLAHRSSDTHLLLSMFILYHSLSGCYAPNEGARDGDALLLPPAEAPLPHERVVAVGQLGDEVVRVGQLRRARHRLLRLARRAVTDVRRDVRREQLRLLEK
eukprot:176685-Prorocentrum_minimum.AAC.1